MNREEIKKALEEKGIVYDGRLKTETLWVILQKATNMEGVDTEEVRKDVDDSEEEDKIFGKGTDLPVKQEYTDVQLKNISDSVSGKNTPTTDEAFEVAGVRKSLGGEMKTASGIVLPPEVLSRMGQTQYRYYLEELGGKCIVSKMNEKGRGVPVREYNINDHGKDYAKLAKQFVEKNNR